MILSICTNVVIILCMHAYVSCCQIVARVPKATLQSKLQSLSSHHIEGSAADLELQAKSLRLYLISYYVFIDITSMQQDAPAGVIMKHALYICVVHVHMTCVMMEALDCSIRIHTQQ